MVRNITPWLLFLFCLALFGAGATPFGAVADHIAVGLRFSFVIFLSILLLRQRYGKRSGTFLDSFRRWSTGEGKSNRSGNNL